MKTIKELVEKSPVIWLLSTLLAGFLAGVGTYRTVQVMAGLTPVSSSLVSDLRNQIALQEKQTDQKTEQTQDLLTSLDYAKNTIAGKHIDIYAKDLHAEPVRKLTEHLTPLQAVVEVKDSKWMEYTFKDKYGIHVKGSFDPSYLLGVCIKIMVPECASMKIHGVSNTYFKTNDPADIRIYLPSLDK